MYEWTGLSRGRSLGIVTARNPREYPVGVFQRDPVPPPHTGPGTFTWFVDHSEAAAFISEVVPSLLLDPESWPDFDALVAQTTRIARGVPDGGCTPMDAVQELNREWAGRADFVWWGLWDELVEGNTAFGRLIRLQYLEIAPNDEPHGTPADGDLDGLVAFLRAYG